MPSHTHGHSWTSGTGTIVANQAGSGINAWEGSELRSTDIEIQYTGGGQGHNHGNTGETSLTTNSTAPGNTGSALSSTQSIMQPYIVMYIWRRTK